MNKKVLVLLGIIAVGAVAYYMYSKSSSSNGEGEVGGEGTGSGTDQTKSTSKPLVTRKDKRQACGRKPILRARKEAWQQCVDAGGVASFDGDYGL